MNADLRRTNNNPLINKSKIEELKEIKGEYVYEQIENGDLKKRISNNLS